MINFSKNFLWPTLIVVVVGGLFVWYERQPKELETIRLGISINPGTGLTKIAADKNFFKEEGLNVEIEQFTGGKFAIQALLGGSLDLTASAELPVVLATLNAKKLLILTEISRTKASLCC